ncbi:CD44 antigen [Pelobates cultripes]|uniref:CD44 antigen n=1 Tax=Pelobates cultripes TaxID=61616 RepID=A0AAD1W4G7_PELCU|nr:CD44 antigen [Pelobates cultripes]
MVPIVRGPSSAAEDDTSYEVVITTENNLTFTDANTICDSYDKAALASMVQVSTAYLNGLEVCKWGWVREQETVMLRLTPLQQCGNSSVGILIKDCSDMVSQYAFCITQNGTSNVLYDIFLGPLSSSYDNASIICLLNGSHIATQAEIETSIHRLTYNKPAWYNWGVGTLAGNGTFIGQPCQDPTRRASAYCYKSKPTGKDCTSTLISSIVASSCSSTLFTGILVNRKKLVSLFKKKKPADTTDAASTSESTTTTQSTTPTYQATSEQKDLENIIASTQYTYTQNKSDAVVEKRGQVVYIEKKVYKSHVYKNQTLNGENE